MHHYDDFRHVFLCFFTYSYMFEFSQEKTIIERWFYSLQGSIAAVYLFIISLETQLRVGSVLLPFHLSRRDASLDRTHIQTEMATYTVIIELRSSLLLIPVDGLMRRIIA